jgi:hypothetical protein
MAQAVLNLGLKFPERLCVAHGNKNRIVPEPATPALFEDHLSLDDTGERSQHFALAGKNHDTSEARRELVATQVPKPLYQQKPIFSIIGIWAGKSSGAHTGRTAQGAYL